LEEKSPKTIKPSNNKIRTIKKNPISLAFNMPEMGF
jgi:hypothetical protein